MEERWELGTCWLCGRIEVHVAYLGPVQEDGLHAPMHGCEPCVDRLRRMLRAYYTRRDIPHQTPARVVRSSTVRPGRGDTGVR